MAVSFVARKCDQCAGRLEYQKDKKMWKCQYCGAEIERTEQYDGLFTIKNVVRQVILDVAYRRLDSAEKNLVECEKIDSRYLGTLIAKITLQMITAITPGASPQADLRNLFAQMKRNYDALRAIDSQISNDEEALYEFFDSADIYATLLLVYDSLGDAMRRDYIAGMLNAEQVYAGEPAKNLLSYALKSSQLQLVDTMMKNTDNLEPAFALSELLHKYPDSDKKIQNIERLLASRPFIDEDKRIIEAYLESSEDSVKTKGKIVSAGYAAGVRAGLERTISFVLAKADGETAAVVLSSVCSVRLSDDDVYRIIDYAVGAFDTQTAVAALSVLKDSRQYVMMTSKYLIALLSRTDLPAAGKSAVLSKMLEFNIDAKSKEAVVSNYLCLNQDDSGVRLPILDVLLAGMTAIQTNTVERYVLTVTVDGSNKAAVVDKIFSLDMNMSFFTELLSKYIAGGADLPEVKDKVIDVLCSKGMKIDPVQLKNFICAPGSAGEKITFTKKMLTNGTPLRGDTVNAYLESITTDRFSSGLFALISGSASAVSELALANYLLLCKDRNSLKVQNYVSLARMCHKSIADIWCEAFSCGQTVSGSLPAVYVLATPDSYEVAMEITDLMINGKAKLNTDITAAAGTVKLKKFVAANQDRLSAVTAQLCAAYRL